MLPVIALVGRPNVGKSTLFNCLTQSRDALVADVPGLTRDRQYGIGRLGTERFVVVDTGGLETEFAHEGRKRSEDSFSTLVARQVLLAIEEADAVLFIVDGRSGLVADDQTISQQLRRLNKPIHLVVNKTEHLDKSIAAAEFAALGLDQPLTIAASHQQGIKPLISHVLATLDTAEPELTPATTGPGITLAIVGRPNVGKSTLINRLLGEQRVLAYDQPGTTRDSIAVELSKNNQTYTLIDTAGVRRRSRVTATIEKFSIIKTLQSIERSHVVVMLLDARQGVAEQDASLLGHIIGSGRGLVIAVNKWDGLSIVQRDRVRSEIDRKLAFLDFADLVYISALHGSGLGPLWQSIDAAYHAATRKLPTPELTRILETALARHQPPLVRGRSIKLRYAHQGGQNPPLIVIHGSRVQHVPASYRRYLANTFRQTLDLRGTPVRIEFKSNENPYQPDAGRKKPPRRSKPVKKR